MKFALLCIGGTVLFLTFCFWLMYRIKYRVGHRHVKILLFGFPIRRIAIREISYASKHPPGGLAERWHNTFRTSHRLLTIEKRRGLFKKICITPKNRYAFLGEIKSAVRKTDPAAEWAQITTFEESTAVLSRANEPHARSQD